MSVASEWSGRSSADDRNSVIKNAQSFYSKPILRSDIANETCKRAILGFSNHILGGVSAFSMFSGDPRKLPPDKREKMMTSIALMSRNTFAGTKFIEPDSPDSYYATTLSVGQYEAFRSFVGGPNSMARGNIPDCGFMISPDGKLIHSIRSCRYFSKSDDLGFIHSALVESTNADLGSEKVWIYIEFPCTDKGVKDSSLSDGILEVTFRDSGSVVLHPKSFSTAPFNSDSCLTYLRSLNISKFKYVLSGHALRTTYNPTRDGVAKVPHFRFPYLTKSDMSSIVYGVHGARVLCFDGNNICICVINRSHSVGGFLIVEVTRYPACTSDKGANYRKPNIAILNALKDVIYVIDNLDLSDPPNYLRGVDASEISRVRELACTHIKFSKVREDFSVVWVNSDTALFSKTPSDDYIISAIAISNLLNMKRTDIPSFERNSPFGSNIVLLTQYLKTVFNYGVSKGFVNSHGLRFPEIFRSVVIEAISAIHSRNESLKTMDLHRFLPPYFKEFMELTIGSEPRDFILKHVPLKPISSSNEVPRLRTTKFGFFGGPAIAFGFIRNCRLVYETRIHSLISGYYAKSALVSDITLKDGENVKHDFDFKFVAEYNQRCTGLKSISNVEDDLSLPKRYRAIIEIDDFSSICLPLVIVIKEFPFQLYDFERYCNGTVLRNTVKHHTKRLMKFKNSTNDSEKKLYERHLRFSACNPLAIPYQSEEGIRAYVALLFKQEKVVFPTWCSPKDRNRVWFGTPWSSTFTSPETNRRITSFNLVFRSVDIPEATFRSDYSANSSLPKLPGYVPVF